VKKTSCLLELKVLAMTIRKNSLNEEYERFEFKGEFVSIKLKAVISFILAFD